MTPTLSLKLIVEKMSSCCTETLSTMYSSAVLFSSMGVSIVPCIHTAAAQLPVSHHCILQLASDRKY